VNIRVVEACANGLVNGPRQINAGGMVSCAKSRVDSTLFSERCGVLGDGLQLKSLRRRFGPDGAGRASYRHLVQAGRPRVQTP